MADIAQAFANEALRNNPKNYKAAVREFDNSFSTLYAGRPMRTTRDVWTSYLFGIGREQILELRGDTGFKSKFRDGNDQTHHFAALLSSGINASFFTATAQALIQDAILELNATDRDLGFAAYSIGKTVDTRSYGLMSIGYVIRRDICGK
jgi:hypothetical protein